MNRKLQSIHSASDVESKRQIAAAKSMSSTKEAEYERKIASMKAAIAAKDSAMEQQLVAVKKVAQTEAEHSKRRNDGEIADLRATITSLQASLQKVGFSASCA